MYLNATSYIKNQTVQYKDAQTLLTGKLRQLEWENEEGLLMDLGCGPGNSTLQLVLPFFPKSEKLVAVDLLPNMIDFAKRNHSHPKIEYEVANIEDWDSVKKWHRSISKIVSIHCMHWLENEKMGFQNVYDLLRQEGEAAFCLTLKSPVLDSMRRTVDDPKWSAYFKGVNIHIPHSQYRKNNSIYYKEMLEEIGFTVLLYEESEDYRTFQSEQECKGFITSFWDNLLSVPEERREDFKDDFFKRYLSAMGGSKDGKLQHKSLIGWLVIKKEK